MKFAQISPTLERLSKVNIMEMTDARLAKIIRDETDIDLTAAILMARAVRQSFSAGTVHGVSLALAAK